MSEYTTVTHQNVLVDHYFSFTWSSLFIDFLRQLLVSQPLRRVKYKQTFLNIA